MRARRGGETCVWEGGQLLLYAKEILFVQKPKIPKPRSWILGVYPKFYGFGAINLPYNMLH